VTFAATAAGEMDGRTVVRLEGDLDLASAGRADAELRRLEAGNPGRLVVDLGPLEFIDSSGIRVLVQADARARRGGGALWFLPGNPYVHRVFQVMRLDQRLTFVEAGPPPPPTEAGQSGLRVALRFEVGAELDSPSQARHRLDALAGDVPDGLLSDVKLLVSELVTNSVRHAGLGGDQQVSVAISMDPARLRIEVTDPGSGFEGRPMVAEPDMESGRGLFLVEHLANRWGTRHDDGMTVWFEIDRQG
jgi:anti-anti-sigma factor